MKITMLVLVLILLVGGFALAQQTVDVGNKYCPVSGRQIGLMGPGTQFEYKGKIYHFCCSGCLPKFQSEPEKYAKIAENEGK